MTHIGRVAPHGHPSGGAGHRDLMNHRGNRLKNNQSCKGIQDAGILGKAVGCQNIICESACKSRRKQAAQGHQQQRAHGNQNPRTSGPEIIVQTFSAGTLFNVLFLFHMQFSDPPAVK